MVIHQHQTVYIIALMELKSFYLSMDPDERDRFAIRCGTSIGHFRNVVYGKLCGEKLAINIERESAGCIRCEGLRPDVDWAVLRGTDCQPKEAA